MFLKSLILIVFVTAVAVVLLGYRQQRLVAMSEMVRLNSKIDESRQAMWELQVKIADHIDPPTLAKALERVKLKLEPTTPAPSAPNNHTVAAPDPAPAPGTGTGYTPRPPGPGQPAQQRFTDARGRQQAP